MFDYSYFHIPNGIEWLLIVMSVAIVYPIVKKSTHGIFDPWLVFIFNQILLLILITFLYINKHLTLHQYIYWLCSTMALLLPLKHIRPVEFPLVSDKDRKIYAKHRLIGLMIIMLCSYQLFADLIFVFYRGIPIINGSGPNPQIYMGGFGIVKYIHDATRILLPPLATYSLYLTGKKKLFYLTLIIAIYPTLIFEWSKVGLIQVISVYWISYLFYFGSTKKLKKMTLIGVFASVLFVGLMFSRIVSQDYGVNVLDSILMRLVQSADSVHIYFVGDAQSSIPLNYYFIDYIFSLITPFFGFPNEIGTIGHVMQNALGLAVSEGYGPSPPAQIIGHIFFSGAGVIYTMFIGLSLQLFRNTIHKIRQDRLVVYLIFYYLAPFIAGDISLFFYYVFIFIFITPPMIVALLFDHLFLKLEILPSLQPVNNSEMK